MLVLPPELTHAQATACLRMLMQAMRAHKEPQLVVDAGPLKVFDSSALAVLLECHRSAAGEGKSFAVKALPAALLSLA
ncbi:STAS domain-containing protein, partial [Diaphorobacter ruginosibacter]|uniref:STAS domain-containing protein n=1 Tax=Diaphorobacter ruginosibacter TaxID=1715720 RepID=UPI0033427B81